MDVRFVARGCGATRTWPRRRASFTSWPANCIFGEGDDELSSACPPADRAQDPALAESCTGGFIANRITNVPGASVVFLAGLVTYSNAAKAHFLGVRAETLAAHGAVSEPVAREMAEGAARNRRGLRLAVTASQVQVAARRRSRWAPSSSPWPPRAGTKVINPVNRYDRETFKFLTCLQALELLRRAMRA